MNRRLSLLTSACRFAMLPVLLAAGGELRALDPAAPSPNGGTAAAPRPSQAVQGFYVQTAGSGTAESHADGSYVITLRDVPAHVLLFGDTAGTAGPVPASSFLGGGAGAPGERPEAARITLHVGDQPFDLDVSESRYDAAARELRLVAKPADPAAGGKLPGEFGHARLVVGAAAISCSDGSVTCHWIVQQCARWFDRPEICQTLGPIDSDTTLGGVSWGRYYCGCDTRCYPDDPGAYCGTEDRTIKYFCEKKYGTQGCPNDRVCYWKGTDANNANCGIKCCGGWCVFKPC